MTLPATIISGFLGAGKTTLVNYLLRNPGAERLAVLVNDFGAINIDQELIKVEAKNQIELANGCVCCSIQDDLAAGLMSISRTAEKFTRVVLECSGVSHPAGVLKVFDSVPVSDAFGVESIVCLIDTLHFMDLDFRSTELAIDQATMSDLVLLNKIDLVSAEGVNNVREVLQDAQRGMKIANVVQARMPTEILFGERWSDAAARPTAMKGDHHELFESVAYGWDDPIDLDDFKKFAEAIPPKVLRGKGLLSLKEGGYPTRAVFQLVGKRSSVEFAPESGWEGSEIILIARRGELDKQGVRDALQYCPGAHRRLPVLNRRRSQRAPFCE
jgi:G3E family GTPase